MPRHAVEYIYLYRGGSAKFLYTLRVLISGIQASRCPGGSSSWLVCHSWISVRPRAAVLKPYHNTWNQLGGVWDAVAWAVRYLKSWFEMFLVLHLVVFSNHDFKSRRAKHPFSFPSLTGPSIDSVAMTARRFWAPEVIRSEAMDEQPGISRRYYTAVAGLCLSKCGEIRHFYYRKDTRVPVEKRGRFSYSHVGAWLLGYGGFCRSRFYISSNRDSTRV